MNGTIIIEEEDKTAFIILFCVVSLGVLWHLSNTPICNTGMCQQEVGYLTFLFN